MLEFEFIECGLLKYNRFVRAVPKCLFSMFASLRLFPESSFTSSGISYLKSIKEKLKNWNLSKSVKTCDERSTFAISIPFFLNVYFHDFSVENYLILYAKQNKLGSESSVSCLKQDSEMSNFCLKQGRGLKASAAHLYPNFP